MKPPSIVIVQPESETRDLLMLAFESRGYMTWTCHTLDIAVTLFLNAQPDVVLIDLDDDQEHGLNFLQAWKQASPRTHMIVQINPSTESQKQEILEHGAHAYLLKPVTPDILFETLNGAEPASAGHHQAA